MSDLLNTKLHQFLDIKQVPPLSSPSLVMVCAVSPPVICPPRCLYGRSHSPQREGHSPVTCTRPASQLCEEALNGGGAEKGGNIPNTETPHTTHTTHTHHTHTPHTTLHTPHTHTTHTPHTHHTHTTHTPHTHHTHSHHTHSPHTHTTHHTTHTTHTHHTHSHHTLTTHTHTTHTHHIHVHYTGNPRNLLRQYQW